MRKALALVAVGALAACLAPLAWAAEATLPEGFAGFRGQLRGALLSKTENTFVLKVDQILREWKPSTATNAQAAVGKELTITIKPNDRFTGQFLKTLAGLKTGDVVEVEAFNLEGALLTAIEVFKKVEAAPPTDRQQKIAALEAQVRELTQAENKAEAEFKRLRDLKGQGKATDAEVQAAEAKLRDLIAKHKAAQAELDKLRTATTPPATDVQQKIAALEARIKELTEAEAKAEADFKRLRDLKAAGQATDAEVDAAEAKLRDLIAKHQAAQRDLDDLRR